MVTEYMKTTHSVFLAKNFHMYDVLAFILSVDFFGTLKIQSLTNLDVFIYLSFPLNLFDFIM